MKLDKRMKKRLLAVTAVVLVLALGAGIWFGTQGKSEPVNVYCFNYIGMTEFWGDSQESYGPVSTDKIQTVVLSDTQTVTEVLVSEGDQVKQGDVLMTYDTTLTDLALERKRLEVEKQKLTLQDAKEQLQKIRNMTPMDPNAMNFPIYEPEEPDLGETMPENEDYVYPDKEDMLEHDGSTVDKAMILWVRDGKQVNNEVFRKLYDLFQNNVGDSEEKQESRASAEPEAEDSEDGGSSDGGDSNPGGGGSNSGGEGSNPDSGDSNPGGGDSNPDGGGSNPDGGDSNPSGGNSNPDGGDSNPDGADSNPGGGDDNPAGNDGDTQDDKKTREAPTGLVIQCQNMGADRIVTVEEGNAVNLSFTVSVQGDIQPEDQVVWSLSPSSGGPLKGSINGRAFYLSGIPEKAEETSYTLNAKYLYADGDGNQHSLEASYPFTLKVEKVETSVQLEGHFYLILKVTEDNMERGVPLIWQGVHVYCYDNDSFGFTLFDASALPDYTLEEEDEEETDTELPEIDFGSGFTAAEIAKMRAEQEKKVKEQELTVRMAEAEYKIMQAEVNNGQVCADFDGEVVSVITEEEARQDKRPLLKVSAGGGFYVEGTVSELEKDNLKIGQEVTVNDWQTGMTYTGTVQSIGDFPSQSDGWNGMGNPNASYYPFTAFVDGSADLQAGSYVSVNYSTGTGENGIYLENPFVRTENGQSYVFVRGQNGKLEKRFVTVGKSLWGSYTEIKSGLTEDDYIAFPYGKTVKEGAPTAEGDLNSLYMY